MRRRVRIRSVYGRATRLRSASSRNSGSRAQGGRALEEVLRGW